MLVGWTRALVLVAVAALLGSVQCYGNCAIAACSSAQTPSSGCHHHKSSHDERTGCLHQHSEFTGPGSGIAKASVVKAVPVVLVLTGGSTAVTIEPPLLVPADTGSPPYSHPFRAISVLRI